MGNISEFDLEEILKVQQSSKPIIPNDVDKSVMTTVCNESTKVDSYEISEIKKNEK